MEETPLSLSWERTRGHLARAWVELPSGDDDLAGYQEFLDHNELGLAMEALAEAGFQRDATGSFWLALADAAGEMNLGGQESDYRRHSQTR